MNVRGKTVAIAVLLAALVALLIWAFVARHGESGREEERERAGAPPGVVRAPTSGNLVVLRKGAAAQSGIRAEPLAEIVRSGELMAYGTVVDMGELLLWLNDYAKASGELEKRRAQLAVSRNEYLRLKELHDNNHNVSDKVLQSAEGKLRSDEAEVRTAERSYRNLHWTARERWGGVIAGWLMEGNPVLERLVRQEVALVLLTVPAAAPIPSPPRSIQVKGMVGRPVNARLVSRSPRMQRDIQGASYYYLASPSAGTLLPGMNVVATISVGVTAKGVFAPAAAVVWWRGRAWGYLQRNGEEYERIEIPTGHPVQGGWFVAGGLSGAGRVVVTGAQLLLSEELRSRIRIEE